MSAVSPSRLIVEASPLISFLKINRFDLLTVFEMELVCTDVVRTEVIHQKQELHHIFAMGLMREIRIERPEHLQDIETLYSRGLGRGESSSIVLAKDTSCLLLMDDIKARKIAANQGIALTSTAEVVVKNIQCCTLSLRDADEFILFWKSIGEFPVKVKSFRELL
ncbi:MAG: hypothetical protein F6J97_21285 [Leptolyngbya sp. SIO4C1]|nr:hypothetical protein [Leptolyngbya sp. SIO4C1]